MREPTRPVVRVHNWEGNQVWVRWRNPGSASVPSVRRVPTARAGSNQWPEHDVGPDPVDGEQRLLHCHGIVQCGYSTARCTRRMSEVGNHPDPAVRTCQGGVVMDTQLLESFVATAEELHFGRAAQRLHLSQSTLSRHISRLERELGAALFDRGPRAVVMTAAGRLLLERGRPLLEDLDSVLSEVGRLGAAEVVHLGSPPYARGMGLVRGLADGLAAADPAVGIEIVYGLSGDLSQRLRRGELDVAVLMRVVDSDEFDVVGLLQPELRLLVPSDTPLAQGPPVALDALERETLLLWPRETNPDLYDAILGIFPAGAFSQVVHLAASWDVILSAVASGEGLSVIMPDLWRPEIPGVVDRPIAGDPRPARLVAAVRRGESRSGVLTVVDELAKRATS